jgi:hypothetical protein
MIPRYGISRTEGPDHDRKFYINVSFRNRVYGPGVGGSKKQAEQNAAYLALQALKKKSRVHDEESIIHTEKVNRFVQGGKRARRRD